MIDKAWINRYYQGKKKSFTRQRPTRKSFGPDTGGQHMPTNGQQPYFL